MSLICFVLFAAAGTALAAEDLRIRTVAGNGDRNGPVADAVAEGSAAGAGWAIAFDPQDRPYVTTIQGELWRIGLDGKWERLWRSPKGTILFGLAVDARGRVFVGDLLGNQVYRIEPGGSSVVVAGNGQRGASGDGGKATEASLDSPAGLAVDGDGNLYISEAGRIRVVNAAGVIGTHASGTGGGGLSIDREGNLYVANFGKQAVQRVTPDHSVTDLVEGSSPLAVAVCPDGGVYFTDMFRLQRLGPAGAEVIAGSLERAFAVDDGPARDARFETPLALACDSRGRLAVYDSTAARVRQVGPRP